jgi:hypothetical protein
MGRPKGSRNKPKVVVPAPPQEEEKHYTIHGKNLGRVVTSEGKTLREAFLNLNVKIDGRGIWLLVVSNGKTTQERVVQGRYLFNLFHAGNMMKEIALKQLLMLFGNL